MNKCCRCKIFKSLENFHKNKAKKSGVGSYCKECLILYKKLNKDKFTEYNDNYYEKNKTKLSKLNAVWRKNNAEYFEMRNKTPEVRFKQGIYQSKSRDISWKLTLEEYTKLIIRPCHYCNISLDNFKGTSLDRIDNNEGYQLDNVLPCCGDCNNIRMNKYTVKETEIMVNALVEYRSKESLNQLING